MMSFEKLWNKLEILKEESPLLDSGDDTKAMQILRVGLSYEDFWDNFISLCQNSDGLAELLGVGSQYVSQWPLRIKENLDKVKKHDEQPENREKQKKEMLPTGQTGAITT